MARMKKYAVLVVGAVMLMITGSCGDEIGPGTVEPSAGPVKDLKVVEVCPTTQPVLLEAVGNVTAGASANISAKMVGEVQKVMVSEGDQVSAGDVLAVLDQEQVDSRLDRARANLESARAQVELAGHTYRRFKNLLTRGSVSKQEFDEMEARYLQAKAAVTEAEAALVSAESMKADATISAPFDGAVTARMVDEGDLASPGVPLFNLETTDGFRVDLVVPESDIRFVSVGTEVSVEISSLEGEPLTGRVAAVSPAADLGSRSFLVKVSLPESAPVRSGTFARVKLPMGETDQILAPSSSVVHRGQITGVYLVDEKNETHFRLIRSGRSLDGQVEVISGLPDCARVVVDPPSDLRDGVKVEGS